MFALKNSWNIVFFLTLLFLVLEFLVGCSNSVQTENATKRKEYHNACEVLRTLNKISDFSDMYGEYGIYIEEDDYNYRIYFGDKLDKMMDSLCKNYTQSTGNTEIITAEQVDLAFTENVQQTINDLMSDDAESNYLYKFFKWCGTSCKDTAVYCEGADDNKETWERWIETGKLNNGDIVADQVSWDEEQKPYAVKFKWQ